MPKPDLQSYIAHDREFQMSNSMEHHIREYKKQDTYGQFERWGYKKIMEAFPEVRSMHIDFGCGGGWLLTKTSPFFKTVVGVEPSASGVEVAKEINKGLNNVQFICADMVEGFKKLEISEPVFVTTTTVLSHIEDAWVEEFLKLVNTLPKGSILFFAESYDQNIQRKLWHVRSRYWWSSQLSNWQLIFNDAGQISNYGIAGYCPGQNNVLSVYKPGFFGKMFWGFQGYFYKLKAVLSFLVKSLF
jgi:SAM-dependent methyltransferase